jgi:hypothetical protein
MSSLQLIWQETLVTPEMKQVHDFFDAGASFALKETEIIDGESRKFLFYVNRRNDGLISREEVRYTFIYFRFLKKQMQNQLQNYVSHLQFSAFAGYWKEGSGKVLQPRRLSSIPMCLLWTAKATNHGRTESKDPK